MTRIRGAWWSAALVVLSNGVLMSTASWAMQVPVLAKHYRVLVYDCRGQMKSQQLAMSQFAVLSYTHMARKRHRVVPLQAGQSVAVGAQVYMQITSCDGPLVARKSRA